MIYMFMQFCVCSYAAIRGFIRLARQTGEVIKCNTK